MAGNKWVWLIDPTGEPCKVRAEVVEDRLANGWKKPEERPEEKKDKEGKSK